jgi:DNA-directed RNA polymerase subunit RPC12/RpoP
MGDVIFSCSGCSKPIAAEKGQVGMAISCPLCNKQVVVPEGPDVQMAPGSEPAVTSAAMSYASVGVFLALFVAAVLTPKSPALLGMASSVLGVTGFCGVVISLMRLVKKRS